MCVARPSTIGRHQPLANAALAHIQRLSIRRVRHPYQPDGRKFSEICLRRCRSPSNFHSMFPENGNFRRKFPFSPPLKLVAIADNAFEIRNFSRTSGESAGRQMTLPVRHCLPRDPCWSDVQKIPIPVCSQHIMQRTEFQTDLFDSHPAKCVRVLGGLVLVCFLFPIPGRRADA